MNYDEILSKKVVDMKPSGIRKFFDFLSDRKDVISLTVGQPDFVTPWHIRDAAIDSLQKGKTYYTSNSGTMELREEICRYMERRYALTYSPEKETLVTVGGSEAIDLAIRACVCAGDEVIIPVPSFVCYGPIVTLAGGTPVYIECTEENRFRLTAEQLKQAITEKTKMIVLPFPNNPTGAILEKEDLEAIAALIRDTNILLLSDEIYAELTYGVKHISIASLPGMRERTIIASGFSKSYAMTGWRIGYTLAPPEITKQMLKIHQYAIMCAPTVSQYAAAEAVKNGDEDIAYMTGQYDQRRKLIVSELRAMGLACFEPQGAFYVFPNIGTFGLSSDEFCERLLSEAGVAIVPGTAFGDSGEGFARISYAYSINHIMKALEKIDKFIHTL
ncbi:MAG: aminotransferase class I/II-fold pyridoxal phosphate-dependent enzyme [Clostridiales bacterium]|nr:aminotransferase class I/II-fold pyridoxal phosphate-dependent enzyme [Clostridiales bacterium]